MRPKLDDLLPFWTAIATYIHHQIQRSFSPMSQNKLDDIYNFLPISDAIATSGQPNSSQFKTIQANEFKTIINLALPSSVNALANEKEIVEELDMHYIQIPVLWENPTLDDLKQFFTAMQQNSGNPIFVHCAANMRVSAFLYLYHRIVQNMSDQSAKAYLHQIWNPNETWQQFIDLALQNRHTLDGKS